MLSDNIQSIDIMLVIAPGMRHYLCNYTWHVERTQVGSHQTVKPSNVSVTWLGVFRAMCLARERRSTDILIGS